MGGNDGNASFLMRGLGRLFFASLVFAYVFVVWEVEDRWCIEADRTRAARHFKLIQFTVGKCKNRQRECIMRLACGLLAYRYKCN